MAEKITISLIKADVGSVAGHHVTHPRQIELANEILEKAKSEGKIIDYFVYNIGDDLQLLLTHKMGTDNPTIHELGWNVFKEVTEKVSKPLKLYAAGQDLLKETFSGNIKGMGPGICEMEIEERSSEPFIVFGADKTSPGTWNLPLYRIFADPMNTAGLVISPEMMGGFTFRVLDTLEGKYIDLECPKELYELVALIGAHHHYVIERVFRTKDKLIAAIASTTRLSLISGRYVGKDDPVLIIRAQSQFPAVGEILAPFATPAIVPGAMRGSHYFPLFPCSLEDAKCTYWDGPPRVVALGFQLCGGKLIGLKGNRPADLLGDRAFDRARSLALELATYFRTVMGEFEPARLPETELEYTTLPQIIEKLKSRFVKL